MNTTSSLVYNGVELTAIGGAESSVVVRKNIETRPNKRATKIIIPGRNGAKYVDEGYFDNVTISYSLIFTDFAKYDAVVNYLLSVKGFARLEDEYDPGIYRMARVTSVNPQTPDREKGYVEVYFECQPERYINAIASVTCSGTNFNAEVTNEPDFCRATETTVGGDYTFTYDGTNWNYQGEARSMSYFGMTITGTPVSGDTFTVHHVNPSVIIIQRGVNYSIANPTYFDAKPRLKVTRRYSGGIKGSVLIGVSGTTPSSKYSFNVDTGPDNREYIYIDSDLEDTFQPNGTSATAYVDFTSIWSNYSYPIMTGGKSTTISIGALDDVDLIGGIELEPRWWKI